MAGQSEACRKLFETIKAHIAKADKAKEKSEQHYIAAGQHLKTLKGLSRNWAEWEILLREHVNLSTGRASELMQIADGRKTVAQVRDSANQRKIKHRESSSFRNEEDDDARDRAEVRRLFAAVEAAEAERAAFKPAAVPTNAKSWRLEVLAKDGRRFENGIRLATEEEIDVYRFLHIGNDFWQMYHDQHIVPVATYTFPSADEPNVQFRRKKNGKITHVLEFPHGGCVWFAWTEVGVARPLPPRTFTAEQYAEALKHPDDDPIAASAEARKREAAADEAIA